MPKYWGNQIFSHGSSPKVGQKQKTEQAGAAPGSNPNFDFLLHTTIFQPQISQPQDLRPPHPHLFYPVFSSEVFPLGDP